ncbi:hypothetical protein [Streptomyces pristinaespiralis]|uniref:hypothetical protein n=1 Tax=Streptomyces pristinaespiralis TaxID=38300 RepID=UPI0033C9C762
MRLAVGTEIKCPGRPGQKAEIADVAPDGNTYAVVVQLNGGFDRKRPRLRPATLAEVGDTITYTFVDPKSMPSALPREEDTPRTLAQAP